MSNKTDEFDSGGISFASKLPTMDQIQELIGNHPTSNSSSENMSERQYGPWRHPRAVNHKYCDSCGESGDLMCCDKCPASFHLECLDPPMSEEDAPSTGEFICKRCTSLSTGKNQFLMKPSKQDDEAASTCSNNSAASGPTTSQVSNRKRRGKKTLGFEPPTTSLRPEHEEIFTPTSHSPFRNTFDMLLFASKYTNPKEFQLPKGLCINDKIPDTYKSDTERKAKGTIELENGIVPIPLKFCHICKRTCRIGPLLQCDFCPLLYHLDCLDPPLSIMPPRTDRWMCPVHAEQAIDNHVLTSSRLSERVRLWDEFSRREDRDTRPHHVKMRFLRRVTTQRQRRLMTGGRPYPQPRVKACVPDGVKMLYKNPPMLLPRLGDFVESSSSATQNSLSANNPSVLSEQEKDIWLQAVLKFNVDALKHVSTNERPNTPQSTQATSDSHPNSVSSIVNGEVNNLAKNGESDDIPLTSPRDLDGAVNEMLQKSKDIDVSKLDRQLVLALAQRQINYMTNLSRKQESHEESKMDEDFVDSMNKTIRLQDGKSVVLTKVPSSQSQRPRAILSLISGGDAVPMVNKRLTIGTDLDQDLCLLEFGHCNYVSCRHAVIFYDQYSRLFELLNYSGHGTLVDSVLYSCDLSSRSPDSPRHKGNRLIRSLACLMDVPVDSLRKNSRRKDRSSQNNLPVTDAQPSKPINSVVNSNETEETHKYDEKVESTVDQSLPCACSGTASSVFGPEGRASGLEGSAVLHHGSVLKFGCLHFVFSVVDPNYAALLPT